MKLFFDETTRRCIAVIYGDGVNCTGLYVDVDEGTVDLSNPGHLYLTDSGEVHLDADAVLMQVKAERRVKIKQEAAERISMLDWRLQRARERAEAGLTGVETVEDVLSARESIRQASNKAEKDVDVLMDVLGVVSFSW